MGKQTQTIGDDKFDERLDNLVRIRFEIGGYFGGTERRTLTFEGEQIVVEREGFNGFMPEMDPVEHYVGKTRTSLIEGLKELHIGKWKEDYYNPEILDGTQWDLVMDFADQSSVESGGSNAFPRNFKRFLNLMEME